MAESEALTSAQRKYLRGLAHGLDPVVRIGKSGLTEGLYGELDEALESHELIKVRFVDWKDRKRELSGEIDDRLKCEQVGKIGHVVIFFRRARDPDKRRIRLPG